MLVCCKARWISARYHMLCILQYTTVYHSILQYIVVYYSISQYITVYCSILQYIIAYCIISQYTTAYCSMLQHFTVYYSILQYTTVIRGRVKSWLSKLSELTGGPCHRFVKSRTEKSRFSSLEAAEAERRLQCEYLLEKRWETPRYNSI